MESSSRRLSRANLPAALAARAGPAPPPGIVHLGLGNFARAHTAVYTAAALEKQPGPWAVVGVAQRSHAVADALLAQDLLYTVLTLAPDRARAYAGLAAIYVHQQKWDQLDEMLGRAEKAVPDDLSPTFQAGRSLVLEKGDADRAERYLRRYLTQEAEGGQPRWAAAHWRLGLVFEKRGMKQKAVEELETAVRLQPGLFGARKDLERLR